MISPNTKLSEFLSREILFCVSRIALGSCNSWGPGFLLPWLIKLYALYLTCSKEVMHDFCSRFKLTMEYAF